MATISQNAYDSIVSAMTTELNSVTNNSWAISGALGADGTAAALYGDWELSVTYGTNPSATAVVELYLIRSADGTNYEDGSASVLPDPGSFVGVFTLRAVTTAQRRVIRDVPMPPGLYKAMIKNASGQTTAASGNTLKVRPHNLKSV